MTEDKNEPIKLMFCDPVPGEVPQPYWAWYQKIVDAVARPGTTVDFVTLKKGYADPTTPYTNAYNALAMIERGYEAEKKGYDAFLIGCASDLGLKENRSLVDIPVAGALESALLQASVFGNRFSIMAHDRFRQQAYHDLVLSYRLGDRLASVRYPPAFSKSTAFGLFAKGELAEYTEAMTAEMKKAVNEDNAEVFMVGCLIGSAVLTTQGIHEVAGAPIIDLLAAQIKMAETMVDLKRAYGISVCRASIYAPPPPNWQQELPIVVE